MRSQFLQSPRLSAIGRRGGDPLAALTSTVVFDPSKRSSLAQDSGGTAAVSADGDPVGRMADLKSDTYHATQAIAVSRPTYKTDGTCHWLAGDGANDFMSLDWYQTAGNSQSVCFGFSLSAEKTWPFLFGGSVGNRGLEVYGFSGDEDMRALACTTGGTKVVGSGDFILAVNRDVVLTATWDRSTGDMALYRDGVLVATASHPAANLTVAAAHDLFRGLASNTYCLPGRLYRAVLYDGLWSVSERAAAEAWVAKNVHTVAYYLGDSTIAAFSGQPSVASLMDSAHAKTSLAVPGDTIAGQTAKWTATVASEMTTGWVAAQVGLNDLDPSESAATALGRLQTLVDEIKADIGSRTLLIGQMTPCRQRLIDYYGATNGPIAYQKWLDMNDAIAGNGANAITGVDGRITAHVALMNDGSGNLAAAYDTGDHIHPNAAGRQIIADAWDVALVAAGVTP